MDSQDQRTLGQQVSPSNANLVLCELTDVMCRITIHNASWDYEGTQPRHGTRVTSLAEKPYFDANAPTRRQALGLDDGN